MQGVWSDIAVIGGIGIIDVRKCLSGTSVQKIIGVYLCDIIFDGINGIIDAQIVGFLYIRAVRNRCPNPKSGAQIVEGVAIKLLPVVKRAPSYFAVGSIICREADAGFALSI